MSAIRSILCTYKILLFALLILFTANVFGDDSLYIDANGNVGIGTTDPGLSPLKVIGNVSTGNNVIGEFQNTYSNNSMIKVKGVSGEGIFLGTDSNDDGFICPVGNTKLRLGYGTPVYITDGKVGIGTSNPGSYKLYVAGSAKCTGVWEDSDVSMKKNIEPLITSLDKIIKLRGVTYQWKDKEKGEQKQLGLIAQEVEEVFPEVVRTDIDGYKAISYSNLVAPLIDSVKELKEENDALKAALIKSEKRISALESSK